MRTNIVIDEDLMTQAMKAGPYKTKKDAVEAGLKLLARQAAYREIIKWRGKLQWEGGDDVDWTVPAPSEPAMAVVNENTPPYAAKVAASGSAQQPDKRRARR